MQLFVLLATTVLGASTVGMAGSLPAGEAAAMDSSVRELLDAWGLGGMPLSSSPWHCRAVFSSFGFLYALAASQLVIAHMVRGALHDAALSLSMLLSPG